jgi:hypothetical protein
MRKGLILLVRFGGSTNQLTKVQASVLTAFCSNPRESFAGSVTKASRGFAMLVKRQVAVAQTQ